MKKTRHIWRAKILAYSSLLVAIPLLLVGSVFSWRYLGAAQQHLIEQHEEYLGMNVTRFEQSLSTIEKQSAQWTRLNIGSTSLPLRDNISNDYLRMQKIIYSMEVQKNSNDWIDRIIYRHAGSGTVLDSEYGVVLSKSYSYRDFVSAISVERTETGWHFFRPADGSRGIYLVNWLPKNVLGECDMFLVVLSTPSIITEINPLPGILPYSTMFIQNESGEKVYINSISSHKLYDPTGLNLFLLNSNCIK